MNILDMVKDQITGTLASQASQFLGESEGAVESALGSAFPAILGSVIEKGSTESGASGLMDMIGGLDLEMLGNIGNIFGGGASSVNGLLNSGGGILDMLLGDKLGGIVNLISKVSGIGSGSSGSLLKMAAPLLMGFIGKKVMGKGPAALMDLLMGQKQHVANAMPAGMGDILGLASFGNNIKNIAGDAAGKVTSTASNVASSAAKTAGTVAGATTKAAGNVAGAATGAARSTVNTAGKAASSGFNWLKAALPLLLLGGLAWWFLGRGGAEKVADAAGSAVSKTAEVASGAASGVADAAGSVADGVADAAGAVADGFSGAFKNINAEAKAALDKISFTAGSAGSQMMDYIKGGFKGDGTFTFNNVNFASGSANLTAQSASEIDNLAAILKTYPDLKIEVHGHTDSQGNAESNKTLSQARAASVVARLVGQGIGNDRMKAMGFGQNNPIADNGTAEGRAKNRRIEVKLVK